MSKQQRQGLLTLFRRLVSIGVMYDDLLAFSFFSVEPQAVMHDRYQHVAMCLHDVIQQSSLRRAHDFIYKSTTLVL